MNKFFNNELNKEDEKKVLSKRLKNIEDKNEEQLKAVKYKAEYIKEVTNFVEKPLRQEAIALINEIKSIQKYVDYIKLKFTDGNKLGIILVIKNI